MVGILLGCNVGLDDGPLLGINDDALVGVMIGAFDGCNIKLHLFC